MSRATTEGYLGFRIVTGRTGTQGKYHARIWRDDDHVADSPRIITKAHYGKGAKTKATQEARDLIDAYLVDNYHTKRDRDPIYDDRNRYGAEPR